MVSPHLGDGVLVSVTYDGSLIIIDGKFLDLIKKGKEIALHNNMRCSGKRKILWNNFYFVSHTVPFLLLIFPERGAGEWESGQVEGSSFLVFLFLFVFNEETICNGIDLNEPQIHLSGSVTAGQTKMRGK